MSGTHTIQLNSNVYRLMYRGLHNPICTGCHLMEGRRCMLQDHKRISCLAMPGEIYMKDGLHYDLRRLKELTDETNDDTNT